MITSGSVSWDGAFAKRSFADRFEVVNVYENEVNNTVEVTIVFDKTPDKEYMFPMDADDFEPSKEYIATEVLRQLQNPDSLA